MVSLFVGQMLNICFSSIILNHNGVNHILTQVSVFSFNGRGQAFFMVLFITIA